jgi:hypothetical protein
MQVTATELGFQKLAGFFYSGLGATYTVTVAAGTGIIKSFNVLKRPVSGQAASSVGVGGGAGTVVYTENADVEFELEVWGQVTRVGTFTVEFTATGGRQGSGLASYSINASQQTGLVNPKDGGLSFIADPVVLKIRATIASARNKNAVDSNPLLPLAAWTATTSYTTGQVVTNAGNQYICGQSITSATTAPVGRGAAGTQGGLAPIADGTGFWSYQGATRTTVASPQAPTVNSGAYTSSYTNTNTYQKYAVVDFFSRRWMALEVRTSATGDNANAPWLLPNFWQLLDRFDLSSNPNSFFVSGGTPVLASPLNGFATHTFLRSNGSASIPTVAFETASPFVILNGAQAVSVGYGFKIEVDGVRLSDSLIFPATNTQLVLDFSALPNKTRLIKISRLGFANTNSSFAGIYVSTGYKVTAPKNANRWRMTFLGDSLLDGGGSPVSNTITYDLGVPMQTANLLGCDDAYSFAIGGVGFLNGNTHISRLAEIAGSNPDVLVIFGAFNDGAFTSPQRVAAFTTFLSSFRALQPNTVIMFFGTWSVSTTSAKTATENDQLTAFNQVKDSRMFFIPVTTDPQGAWNDGESNVTTAIAYPPNATGSAQYYTGSDGTHQSPIATDYIAKRMASAIENIFS